MRNVFVERSVLRWALDRSGRPFEDIERRFPKLQQWISGESQPSLRQLENLAKATYTPLGYFFLSEPPEEKLPIPQYRTIDDDSMRSPSPDLLETVQIMERRQTWMREYLIDQGNEPLPFVNSAKINEDPVEIARDIRRTLGIDEEWASSQPNWKNALGALILNIQEAGILVAVNGVVGNNTYRKLDPDEFRGFVLHDEYAPLIFVNGADYKVAQIFTIAHELSHIWFGSSGVFDLRGMQPAQEPTELACNNVAAEFLVPKEELSIIWNSARKEKNTFQFIAHHFKVSNIVAARRTLDLKLINKNDFFEYYRQSLIEERIKSKKSKVALKTMGGNFYASQNYRIGLRFAHTVISAAKEGKLLYREAYDLTGLHGKTFDQYADTLGYGGS